MKIQKKIKYNVKYFLSQTPLRELLERYRHKGLKENDVFLVSYQNSGSTWLRNLLYEAITGKEPWKPESKKEFAREYVKDFLSYNNFGIPRWILNHIDFESIYECELRHTHNFIVNEKETIISKFNICFGFKLM